MKKQSRFITDFFGVIRSFYRNEQGVYSIMIAVLSFVILALVALAVDGSGLYLDKARFSQGIEQAGLALIAENNEFRERGRSHFDVKRQNPTLKTKEAKDIPEEELREAQHKRNQELIEGIARYYYHPATYFKDPSNKKINDEYQYSCKRLLNSEGKLTRNISCEISGSFERPSWLYFGKSYEAKLTFGEYVNIQSDKIYLQKNISDIVPIDVVLVTDFSGSMLHQIEKKVNDNRKKNQQAPKAPSKIEILREVVQTISNEALGDDENESVNKINPSIHKQNRIRFVGFAAGAKQFDKYDKNPDKCYLPYAFKPINPTVEQLTTEVFGGKLHWTDPLSQEDAALIKVGIDAINVENIDIPETIKRIEGFSGTKQAYDFTINHQYWHCITDLLHSKVIAPSALPTTSNWYGYGKAKRLTRDFVRITPGGNTLISSGVIIGANLLMDVNGANEAKPNVAQMNTRRVLLILSDGVDEFGLGFALNNSLRNFYPKSEYEDKSPGISEKLVEEGMCDKIIEKLNALQDPHYETEPPRIGFIAFGYIGKHEGASEYWKKCVKEHYYVANNKEQLLDAFRQIIGLSEEVGHVVEKQ
ncbi:TadE/TadG family type IV pilus assembly protein [Caviibacterium pharyngocola]|uniref:Uncharacterized protein n=1 Tax=Caviibacterium pharyngocola TaxID=28159 RepID=A0A2M8RWU2_9PAST|nr:TadE/TadG family type IV pilus assembly protein [Caviibacterium pharyngocola]PJG83365.1 hypothetical protein CVP04_04375 [Caviibacterium pharyngocola]